MENMEQLSLDETIKEMNDLNDEMEKINGSLTTLMDFHEQVLIMGVSKGIASSVEILLGEPLSSHLPITSYTALPSVINRDVALEGIVVGLFKLIGKVVELILKVIGKTLEIVGKSITWIVTLGNKGGVASFSSGGTSTSDTGGNKPETKATGNKKDKKETDKKKEEKKVQLIKPLNGKTKITTINFQQLDKLVNTINPKISDIAVLMLDTIEINKLKGKDLTNKVIVDKLGETLKSFIEKITKSREAMRLAASNGKNDDINGYLINAKEDLKRYLNGIKNLLTDIDKRIVGKETSNINISETSNLNNRANNIVLDAYKNMVGTYTKIYQSNVPINILSDNPTLQKKTQQMKDMAASVRSTMISNNTIINTGYIASLELSKETKSFDTLSRDIRILKTQLKKATGDAKTAFSTSPTKDNPDSLLKAGSTTETIEEELKSLQKHIPLVSDAINNSVSICINLVDSVRVNKRAVKQLHDEALTTCNKSVEILSKSS